MPDPSSAPATLSPEMQELEKLRKANAEMGYRLRQYETQPPAPESPVAPIARSAGGHPLSSFLGDGDYGPVDQYYQRLIQQQGYLTTAQWQERETALRQELVSQTQFALANIHHFRMLDKTLNDKTYAKFADPASAESKRLAEILQQNTTPDGRPWGQPAHAKATSWDEWQFAEPSIFRQAADIAASQLFRETQASAATTAAAQATQQAGELSTTPASTAELGPRATGKPALSTMKDAELLDNLDAASPP